MGWSLPGWDHGSAILVIPGDGRLLSKHTLSSLKFLGQGILVTNSLWDENISDGLGSWWQLSWRRGVCQRGEPELQVCQRKGSTRIFHDPLWARASQLGTGGKESTCQCRRCQRHGLDSWVRKILWSRIWKKTPGKPDGQRSLVGYSQTRLSSLSTIVG